jgi:hypothetical protein
MTDAEKLEKIGDWLIDQAINKGTDEMRVFHKGVKNSEGKDLGDWEIIVQKSDKSKIFIPR